MAENHLFRELVFYLDQPGSPDILPLGFEKPNVYAMTAFHLTNNRPGPEIDFHREWLYHTAMVDVESTTLGE